MPCRYTSWCFLPGLPSAACCGGGVAAHAGIPVALLGSAAGALCWQRSPCADSAWAVATRLTCRRLSIGPIPEAAGDLDRERGPVLVTVEYEIELAQREAFLDAMQQLGTIRRRDGAFSWGVFEDIAVPGRYIELFQQDSWLDHLRQHARVTREDQRVQEIIHRFHIGAAAPGGCTFYRRRAKSTYRPFNGNRLMTAFAFASARTAMLST